MRAHVLCGLSVVLLLFRFGSPPGLAQTAPSSPTGPQQRLLKVTVRDATGATIPGAEVRLLTPERSVIAAARTDAGGHAALTAPRADQVLVVVRAQGFSEQHTSWQPWQGSTLEITLDVVSVREEVTVTASPDTIQDTQRSAQPVTIVDDQEIALRAKTVVAQAVAEEAGVDLQRTSPTIAGIYIRGFTGNKVNVFVDGVRYSTSAQRGGINTFLDLLEPGTLEVVEVLRGPNSAQYGSDAIGGSVQFLSRVPPLSPDGRRHLGGEITLQGATADRGIAASVLGSLSTTSLGLLATIAGRDVGTLRPGRGIDSHAALTRFLGLRSNVLMPSHLPDTGFAQYGGFAKVNWVVTPTSHLVAQYRRSRQERGKRYDQLLGGDGNLVADLRGLTLDLASVRLEQFGAGPFDDASIAYSVNSQREERVNQGGNGNPRATITFEPERTTAHGIQASGARRVHERFRIGVGGDAYFERVSAASTALNPVTGETSIRRGRVPDNATYRSGGVWAQTTVDAWPDRFSVVGNLRWSGATYRARAEDSPLVNGRPLWPDDRLSVSNVTFRAGTVFTPAEPWTLSVNLGRGFRAPHITDLGTLGLTGSGFEVAAPDVAGLGATVGTTADATAVSSGQPVTQVLPETSLSIEGSVRYRARRVRFDVTVFRSRLFDSLEKQSLILPPGAVGLDLAGEPITAQTPGGAVFVGVSTNPVLVRTNLFDAISWGIEHSGDVRFTDAVALSTIFTYVRSAEAESGRPPNIEGGTPPANGYVLFRLAPASGRWWVQPYGRAAARQARLSTLDLSDRRTGATRTRANIRSFFYNGATVRGWVVPGPDGVSATADDVLSATGETLAQVQDRVLGPSVNSAPLFTAVPGYVTLGIRGGVKVGPHEVLIDAENLTDRNYRGPSWGIDAPGRGLTVRYQIKF